MNPTVTEDDEGKRIVGPDGEQIGTVEKVDTGVIHVEADAELPEATKERFDWGERGDDYTLQETEVESVTDEQVVLRGEGGD